MATSGTFTHNSTRTEIISRALRIIGVLDAESQSANATQLTNGAEALNSIIKSWNALGLLIWTRNLVAIPLVSSKPLYLLGTGTSDTVWQITNKTTTSAAASSGATTITVTDTTGIADNDGIGIQLDSGQWQWSQVNGAPAGSTVTIDDALTDDVDQYAPVMIGVKPSRVIKIRDGYITNTTGNDTPVRVIPKEEYLRFGSKSSLGTSVQVYYDPQLSSGVLHLYPVHNSSNHTMFLECETVLEDIAAASDNPGLPQEWLNALVWNLAYELAIEWGVPEKRLQFINAKAGETLSMATWTSQEENVYFQPDRTMYW